MMFFAENYFPVCARLQIFLWYPLTNISDLENMLVRLILTILERER